MAERADLLAPRAGADSIVAQSAAACPAVLASRDGAADCCGAVLGAIAGINGWLVWLLMRRYHGWSPSLSQRLLALVVLVLALTGSLFLSFLGTTWAEYLCSCFVIAALLPLLSETDDGRLATGWRPLLLASLSMGAACGLKLTNLVYAIGLTAALLAVTPRVMLRWRGLVYAAGGSLGFLVTGGFWAVELWRELGNPMFPFFNAVFGSPMFGPTNFADQRFIRHRCSRPPGPIRSNGS